MNVLVVGYGSIGKRHVINLCRLDCIDEIIIYTKVKEGFENQSEKKIIFIDAAIVDLPTVASQYKIDFAMIANETFKHVDTAIALAEKGCHLFIEKPLSHNLEKIDLLKEMTQKKQIKVFVAYNLRYLPAIQYIKDQISKHIIGDLYFAKIEVGQYLPSWRPKVSYTDSYSANAEYGGGVALDLSHEVDYMRYLFGDPCLWKTMRSKASDLVINSEDIFEGIYKYKQGFVCSVHMDYLQRKAERKIRIVGSRGEIVCDFMEKWIKIKTPDDEIRLTEEKLFKMEDTYKNELQEFIETITSNKPATISIDDGIKALELLEDSYDR